MQPTQKIDAARNSEQDTRNITPKSQSGSVRLVEPKKAEKTKKVYAAASGAKVPLPVAILRQHSEELPLRRTSKTIYPKLDLDKIPSSPESECNSALARLAIKRSKTVVKLNPPSPIPPTSTTDDISSSPSADETIEERTSVSQFIKYETDATNISLIIKGDLLKRFEDCDVILKLKPSMRQELRKALLTETAQLRKSTETQLAQKNGSNNHSDLSDVTHRLLLIEKVLIQLSVVEKEQDRWRFANLIALIKDMPRVKIGEPTLWEKLIMAGEKIIDCSVLFKLILDEIRLAIRGPTPRSLGTPRTSTIMLLRFCQQWLHFNLRTALIPRVYSIVREISACIKGAPVTSEEKEFSSQLDKELAAAILLEPTPPLQFRQADKIDSIAKILEEAAKDSILFRSSMYAKKVALDLFYCNLKSYTSLHHNHFLPEKWVSGDLVDADTFLPKEFLKRNWEAEIKPSKDYMYIFDNLTKVFVFQLLQEKTPEGRAKIVKFMLQVAKYSLENGDYPTAHALTCFFSSNTWSRLGDTREKVMKNSDVKEQISELEALFSPMKNYYNYRSKEAEHKNKKEQYFPLFQVLKKDIAPFEEDVTGENSEFHYNFDEVGKIYSLIHHYLSGQKACTALVEDKKWSRYELQTDIVPLSLGFKAPNDEEFYSLADTLEPRKT